MSGKNISPFTGNMLFRAIIGPDEEKIEVMAKCIKSIKRKLNISRTAIGIFAVALLVSLFFLMETLEGIFLFLLEFLSIYLIIVATSFIFIRPKLYFPVRYTIMIHEIPGRVGVRSLVIVPEYFPRGREVIMIPLHIIGQVGVIESTRKIKCTKEKILGTEIFISDKRGKEIARFGFMGREDDVKKTATELWGVVEKMKTEEKSDENNETP